MCNADLDCIFSQALALWNIGTVMYMYINLIYPEIVLYEISGTTMLCSTYYTICTKIIAVTSLTKYKL